MEGSSQSCKGGIFPPETCTWYFGPPCTDRRCTRPHLATLLTLALRTLCWKSPVFRAWARAQSRLNQSKVSWTEVQSIRLIAGPAGLLANTMQIPSLDLKERRNFISLTATINVEIVCCFGQPWPIMSTKITKHLILCKVLFSSKVLLKVVFAHLQASGLRN